MKRRIFLFIVVFGFLFTISTQTVRADDPPPCNPGPCVYVDSTKTDANEDGTSGHPYNDKNEGKALAQAKIYGAYLYVKGADGTWTKEFVPSVVPGAQGTPIPEAVLYIALAVLALGLILAGLWFMRRSRQVHS